MRRWAVLDSLPDGYEVVRGRSGFLAAERGALGRLRAVGFGADGGEVLPDSGLVGRAPLGAIEAEGERWLVRRFHHGGALRALGERLFLAPARPFVELTHACALRAAGFDVPRVVAARALRSAPFGWRLALVSARVEGRVEAAELLERMRAGELAEDARRRLARTLGELLGRLHAARFLHADLTPRNLLLEPDLTRAWLLDLDRARFVRTLAPRARRDNLRRFLRAVLRREARARAFLRRSDLLRFLLAYAAARAAPGEWRDDWRAIARRHRRARVWHALGWRLERWLGGGPEARDGAARPRT
jgi:tRNA A-37 threonylcarbamoyl transferase component Bud32